MTDISHPVQFLGDNCETGRLLEIETGWGDEVSRSEEVSHLGTNVVVRATNDLFNVSLYGNQYE